jgi:hypothetical protein
MPMKQTGRKVYRSMQGKSIDMDLLRQRNELTPAVGNAKVNARGDELGPGGKIIRPKEEVLKDYYKSNSGVKDELATKKGQPTAQTESQPTAEELAEWEEDDEGNFVKKGE